MKKYKNIVERYSEKYQSSGELKIVNFFFMKLS
jgi:hypothetical protein